MPPETTVLPDDVFNFLVDKNFHTFDPPVVFSAMAANQRSKALVLLSKIPNVWEVKPYDDRELIHYAAMYNYVDVLKLCINNRVPVDKKEGESVITPLILAWNYASFDALQFLLENKANVNQTIDENGNTFLHDYVLNQYNKDSKFLDILLKYGIDKKIKNKDGFTAYDLIAKDKEAPQDVLAKLKA